MVLNAGRWIGGHCLLDRRARLRRALHWLVIAAIAVMGWHGTAMLAQADPEAAPDRSGLTHSDTLSLAALQAAAAYSREQGGRVMLVLRGGEPVFADAVLGYDIDTPHRLFSGTKSFWGVAAMCMVEDGLLNLQELVADAIIEWHSDTALQRIRARQLLEMNSGLDPAFLAFNSLAVSNLFRYAIGLRLRHEPGRAFDYGPGHYYVFGVLMERKLEAVTGENPLAYLKRRVLDPLGVQVADWRMDPAGNPFMSTGASLSAAHWARFGQMILNQGYLDEARIVRADLLAQCFRPSRINPGYGLGFWLNRPIPIRDQAWEGSRDNAFARGQNFVLDEQERYWIAPDAPGDLVMAAGAGGQRLYIIPSHDMVVVRFGQERHPFRDSVFLELLLGHVAQP